MYRILRTDSVACPWTKYNKIAYRQRAFLTTLNKNKCNCVGGVGIASRLGKRTVAQLERERERCIHFVYVCVCVSLSLSLFFLCFYSSISLYISLSLYLFMYSIHPFQPLPPLPPLPPFPPLSSLPSFPSLPSKSTEVWNVWGFRGKPCFLLLETSKFLSSHRRKKQSKLGSVQTCTGQDQVVQKRIQGFCLEHQGFLAISRPTDAKLIVFWTTSPPKKN